MSYGFETINDLLDVMDGLKTDVPLHAIQSDATKDYAILALFDRRGNVLLQSGIDAEADPVWIESLKKTALSHLEKSPVVQFYFPEDEFGSRLDVLGVCLDSTVALIAWPCEMGEDFVEAAYASEHVMKLIDALVGQVHGVLAENNRFSTRIEHFHAEQKVLWESQSEAIRQAYEEREQRFREKQEYLQKLYHTQKVELIGQLAAGIAHEINTPIQYIGNNVTFLKRSFESLDFLLKEIAQLASTTESAESRSEAIDRMIESIDIEEIEYLIEEIPFAITQTQEGVQHVSQIVRSMKDFSYPNSEEQQAVDINGALQTTLLVSRGEWKSVATPETDFQEDLPMVLASEGECSQVFLNLVINAIHAISDRFVDATVMQGVIRLTTRQVGDEVEVRVSDNGSGIPEEVQDRIFDPFFYNQGSGAGYWARACDCPVDCSETWWHALI